MNFQTVNKLDMRTGAYHETLVDLSRLVCMTERNEFFEFSYPRLKKENRIVTNLRLSDNIAFFVKESADTIRGML